MRSNNDKKVFLGIIIVLLILVIYFFIRPIAHGAYAEEKAYETLVSYRNDYKLHTTPLSETVVRDICAKFNIKASNSCQENATVYAPEFFDDIEEYFTNVPGDEKTFAQVQDKIGVYLDHCERPDPQGIYVCYYDIRGDGVYSMAFFFNKNDLYYWINTNVGGS